MRVDFSSQKLYILWNSHHAFTDLDTGQGCRNHDKQRSTIKYW